MMETVLALLLALGGRDGAPAASPGLTPAPGVRAPVTGVWRGSFFGPGGHAPVPVDAVLAPGRATGTLVAVVIAGVGRERRTVRLSGRYEIDGARLALPSGGALRLNVEGSRLVGELKGGGRAGFVPGDGALELTRVRR